MAAEGCEPLPSVPMEVQTDRGEADDSTGDGGSAVCRSITTGAGRDRVEQLSKLLKQQQEVIYCQESVSKHFSGDVLRVAERCWQQIHPKISEAIEAKYQEMFKEFGALEQLSKLDKLRSEQSTSLHPWRPSGIPREDYNVAAGAEAKKMVPEFEKQYTEAQRLTSELQERIQARKQVLEDLEKQIRTTVQDLRVKSSKYSQT